MIITALCIGGPSDGKIVTSMYGRTMRTPVLPTVTPTVPSGLKADDRLAKVRRLKDEAKDLPDPHRAFVISELEAKEHRLILQSTQVDRQPVQFVEYRTETIASRDGDVHFWVAEGLTTFDAMTRLIESYAKGVKQ